MIQMNEKIIIKREKKKQSLQEQYNDCVEEWVAYWRANPHRFITDYLGLKLYSFQKVLIYQMNMNTNYIFVGSRGIAKSTLTLLFAIQRACLYPGQKILVVCPAKGQSSRFIKKIYELMRESPNLQDEIVVDKIKSGIEEPSIPFKNGSKIFAAVYGENSLGIRADILIIDEFVRTEKEIITRVFDPMLSDSRKPLYLDVKSKKEKRKYYEKEDLKKIYLSSIRRADEWSYKELENYIELMTSGDETYGATILPYQLGVKEGFISKKKVEDVFRSNMDESPEIIRAEYLAIPERGTGNSYFTYNMFEKIRNNSRALYCMSDLEYIEYKGNFQKWFLYQEKIPNEIRLLCIDIALLESSKNDNTAIFIIRLIPDGGRYKKVLAYGESMHGINSIIQVKRAKQLFYELECDWVVLDTQGSGQGIFDYATIETYDSERGVVYPAWTVTNYEDVKMVTRTISNEAVPVIYSVKTPVQLKSAMFSNMRNLITSGDLSLLSEMQEAIDYLNQYYKYYNIEDDDLKNRMLNSYAQTDMLINEAINLDQVVVQGYLSLKEKSGRRKDRVMAVAYGLWYAKKIEDEYINMSNSTNILDYVFYV